MKGRGQLFIGGLTGLLVGAGAAGLWAFKSGHNYGYEAAVAQAQSSRIAHGTEQFNRGHELGLETGKEKGLEQGLKQGREEGFAAAGIFDDPRAIYDVDGNLEHGSINVMFGGFKYNDHINSRMTPANARIICDLRGISQPLVDDNVNTIFNKRNLLNLVWHNGLPEGAVRVYISAADKKRWEEDPEVQRIMNKYFPPGTKYDMKIVPEGSLATVDYVSQFLHERKPLSGYEFTPERVRLSDRLPASEKK